MTKEEYLESRRRIFKRKNEEDPTGMRFAWYAMLTWERARAIQMAKRAAKKTLKEIYGDEHWQTHRFMRTLGTHIRSSLKKDWDGP